MAGAQGLGRSALARIGIPVVVALSASALGTLVGCDRGAPSTASARQAQRAAEPEILVTVPPLKGLVEMVAPAGVRVRALMAPGRSEHGYEFTPADLAAMARADLVVYVGLGLEPAVAKLAQQRALPAVNFADAVGIKGEDSDHHDHEGHVHTEACEHGHGADPHLWLDPVLVEQLLPALSARVRAALEARGPIAPATLAELDERLASARARVKAIDEAYRTELANLPSRAIVTHHAAWGRLAERYNLTVAEVLRPVESAEPDAARVAQVASALRERKASVIFVEPQFSQESARRVAEAAGVGVAVLDPLGSGDWEALMRANLRALVQGLGGGGGGQASPGDSVPASKPSAS